MKQNLKSLTLLFIALAMLIIGPGYRANAGAPAQYDIPYAIRISGTGPLLLKYLGTSGTYLVISSTEVNGCVQTTGSGLTVNASPIVTGTANIPSPIAGQLGTSATGQLLIWTGANWVH